MSEIKVNKISPATSTDITLGDSGDTFTVPSGATIVNSGTATGFGGGGKLGQVVAVHHTAQESTSSTTFVDVPSIVVAITPTAASSKIMVMYTLTVGVDDRQLCFNMLRDINGGGYAQVSMGDASGNNTRVNNAYSGTSYYWDYMPFSMSHQYLDEPSYSVGNAITYKLQWRVLGDTSYINSSRDQTNHVNYVRSPSQISAWEILA
jgi:hypothetical protein